MGLDLQGVPRAHGVFQPQALMSWLLVLFPMFQYVCEDVVQEYDTPLSDRFSYHIDHVEMHSTIPSTRYLQVLLWYFIHLIVYQKRNMNLVQRILRFTLINYEHWRQLMMGNVHVHIPRKLLV